MLHFMTAITYTNTNSRCCFYYLRCSFVIEHMKSIFVGEYLFVDINPSNLRFSCQEKILNKIFLHIHILVIEFRKRFLVNIISVSHQRKLEKACHRRWHRIYDVVILHCIEQQSFVSQVIQYFCCILFTHFPDSCCFFDIKGFYWKQ